MANSINQSFKKDKEKKRDSLFTPKVLVSAIMPYIDDWYQSANQGGRKPYILMPFDLESSEFVFACKEYKLRYKFSHIDTGTNFFDLEKPKDGPFIVLSNPPFSLKRRIFERLYEWNVPFALVANLMCLNYMEIGTLFANRNNDIQLLIPNKRVSFDGNPSSFCSAYFCRNLLPQDLMFCKLPHCNSGKDFIPSRMYESVQKIK